MYTDWYIYIYYVSLRLILYCYGNNLGLSQGDHNGEVADTG